MTHEWKPGQVALVDSWRGEGQIAFRCERVPGVPHWCVLDGTDTRGLDGDEVANARPVVVIDPEDRDQIERLLSLARNNTEIGVESWQAALREFAQPTPPKPQEPTDPKARVTDRRDNIWRLLADGDWVCVDGPDTGEYLVWWQLAERGPLTVQGVAQ